MVDTGQLSLAELEAYRTTFILRVFTSGTVLHDQTYSPTVTMKTLHVCVWCIPFYQRCVSDCLSAQENSWHLATLPVVSPPNDVWETSAEISYWWHVTTQIWVVLLIGCDACEIWFNQSEKSELKITSHFYLGDLVTLTVDWEICAESRKLEYRLLYAKFILHICEWN